MATNSSDLIPKERLSAYQRWEMACLETAATPPPAPDLEAERATLLATEQAHAHDVGYAEGYAAGRTEAAALRARFETLVERLNENIGDHQQRLMDEVLNCALIMAQRLVGEALRVRRDLVLPIVAEALKQLPQTSQRVQISLNPVDVALVRDFIAKEPSQFTPYVVGDASISAGGCRIDTEQSEVDATIESRWCRLLLSLGQSDDWLEHP